VLTIVFARGAIHDLTVRWPLLTIVHMQMHAIMSNIAYYRVEKHIQVDLHIVS
jgi:hypothetical protein